MKLGSNYRCNQIVIKVSSFIFVFCGISLIHSVLVLPVLFVTLFENKLCYFFSKLGI